MTETNRPYSENELVIRRMDINDIAKVVEVHLLGFPNFFLTFLGPFFLKEFYSKFD